MQRTLTAAVRLVGVALLAMVGVIHLALAPTYSLGAAYVGALFYIAGVAAFVTALALLAGVRGAWVVGGLVAAGTFAGLLASATVGLPGFRDSLGAPWAMLALLVEAGFVAVYLSALAVRRNVWLARRLETSVPVEGS